jgi:hypothetical protein
VKISGSGNSNISVTQNNLYGNTGGALIVEAGGYSGTLNATNNWWGSPTGPGGIGGGFGDAITAPDHNVNFNPFATKLITGSDTGNTGGNDAADESTPRGLRQILIEDLAAIRDKSSGRLRHFLNDAIANFKASLDASLWVDDSHLAPGAGETLFKLDAKALKLLRKAIKHTKRADLPDGIKQTIQRITNLERMMAMIAIDSASGGKANKLRKANHELSAGVNEVNRGNYAQAIGHFLAAWKFAIQAGHKKHKKAPAPKPAEDQNQQGENDDEHDDKDSEDHDKEEGDDHEKDD